MATLVETPPHRRGGTLDFVIDRCLLFVDQQARQEIVHHRSRGAPE